MEVNLQLFGGRGASSTTGLGGGSVSSITDIDKSKLSLPMKLRYGRKDKSIGKDARNSLNSFETRFRKSKYEQAQIIDEHGNIVEQTIGGVGTDSQGNILFQDKPDEGSVSSTIRALNTGVHFTHTHPREVGMLGGTFSPSDINNFCDFKLHSYRASAKEGAYTISKTETFDSAGLKKYFSGLESQCRSKYDSETSAILNAFNSGKIDVNTMTQRRYNAFNKFLINLHNGLRKEQKTYGYKYSLEKRGK